MFYIDLFNALKKYPVQYLLIGSLAVSLHGIERATMDIDITVATQATNLQALLSMAEALYRKPVLPIPLSSLTNLELLQQWHKERNLIAFALSTEEIAGVTLDILLFPPVDFSEMQTRAVTFTLANVDIEVAAIDDLIRLKQAAGRPIDLSNIQHLEKLKLL